MEKVLESTLSDEKILLWDIDGTLINCYDNGKKALNKAFLKVYNRPDAFNDISMAGKLDYNIVTEVFSKHAIDSSEIDDFYKVYGKVLKDEMVLRPGYQLPGIVKFLSRISKNKKIINCIATGNCEIGAKVKLKMTNLDTFFKYGSYGNMFSNRSSLVKGGVEAIESTINAKVLLKNIFVIGDTPDDILAAHNNGYNAVAVATGRYSVDELKAYKPKLLFKNLEKFDNILSVINK